MRVEYMGGMVCAMCGAYTCVQMCMTHVCACGGLRRMLGVFPSERVSSSTKRCYPSASPSDLFGFQPPQTGIVDMSGHTQLLLWGLQNRTYSLWLERPLCLGSESSQSLSHLPSPITKIWKSYVI